MSSLSARIIVAGALLGTTFLGRPILAPAQTPRPPEVFVSEPAELRPLLEEFKAEFASLRPALARLGGGVYGDRDHEQLSRGLAALGRKAARLDAVITAHNEKWMAENPGALTGKGTVSRIEGVEKAVEAERRLWDRVLTERVIHAASTKLLFEALRAVEFELVGTEPSYDFKGNPHYPRFPAGLGDLSSSIGKGLKADDQGVLSTRLAAAFDGGGGGADATAAVAAAAPETSRGYSGILTAPPSKGPASRLIDGVALEQPERSGNASSFGWGGEAAGGARRSALSAYAAVMPDFFKGSADPARAELAQAQRDQSLLGSVQAACAWLESEGDSRESGLLNECRGVVNLPSARKQDKLRSLRARLEARLDTSVAARVEARALSGEAAGAELKGLETEKAYIAARGALGREVTENRDLFAAFPDGTVFTAAELGLSPEKAPSGFVAKATWHGLPGFKPAGLGPLLNQKGFESLDGSVTVETMRVDGRVRELAHSYDGEKIKIAVYDEEGKELGATIFAPDKKRSGLFASYDAAARWPETVGRFVDGRFQTQEVVNEDGSLSRPLPDFPEVWVNVERGGGEASWTFDTRRLQGLQAPKRIERILSVCEKFMGVKTFPETQRVDLLAAPLAGSDNELLRKKARVLAALIFDFADAGEPATFDGLSHSVSIQEAERRVVGVWNDGKDSRNKRWGLTAYGVHEGKDPMFIAHYLGWNDRDVFRESTEDNFDSTMKIVAFGYQISNVDWVFHQTRDSGNGLKWKTSAKEKIGEQLIWDGPGIIGHVGNTIGTAAKGVVDIAAGVIAAAQIVNPGYYATVKAVGGDIDVTEMPKRAWSNFAGNAIVRTWFDQDQLAKIGVNDKIALRNVRDEMTSLKHPLAGAVLSAGVSFADNTVMMIPTVAAFNAAGRLGQAAGFVNTTKLVQGGAAVYFTAHAGSDLVSTSRDFVAARRDFDPKDPASKARYYDSVENLLVAGGNMGIIVAGMAEAKFARPRAPAAKPVGSLPAAVADEAILAWLRGKGSGEPAAKPRGALAPEEVAASREQRARLRKLAEKPKGAASEEAPASAPAAAQRRAAEIFDEGHVAKHLRELEPAQKGKASFRGGHRMDALLEGFLAHEHAEGGRSAIPLKVQIEAVHANPEIKGSYLLKYREEGVAGGKASGSFRKEILSKTVYDPAVIPDAVMMRWGKEAVLDAVRSGKIPAEGKGSAFWRGRANDGTLMEGWLRNGKVETFWPAYEGAPAGAVANLKTIPLQPRYQGLGVKSRENPAPEIYLTEAERESFRLTVKDGKLCQSDGRPFDTSRHKSPRDGQPSAIFVMDALGGLYAGRARNSDGFYHSSFLAGGDVAFAGEIVVRAGVIQRISNKSGHYKTPESLFGQLVGALGRQGIASPASIELIPAR